MIKLRLNSEKKNKWGKNRKFFSSNNTGGMDRHKVLHRHILHHHRVGTMEERILREANVATDIDF
jgi:hypothetical protein